MSLWEKMKEKILDQKQEKEIEDRMKRLPNKVNELGYDEWGMHLPSIQNAISALSWLGEKYFGVEVHGIEQVPSTRVLLIPNHGGQLPIDGTMVCYSMFMKRKEPRIVRCMADRFMPRLPFVSTFMMRCGQVIGTPLNCKALLEKEEAVLVFPEGTRGLGKLYWKRYQLQEFGTGFMRLALETGTPIVPVAVIGAEEAYPAFYNMKAFAKFFKIPYCPITPFWPLLGPVGLLPIPTKIHIYFGEPMTFSGDFDGLEHEIQEKVDVVQRCLQRLIQEGLQKRKKIFS